MDGISIYNGCLTNRPCLLGVIPLGDPIHEVPYSHWVGYINLFMYLLQIRKNDVIDSDYDINGVPFDLLLYTLYDAEDDSHIDKTICDSIPANNLTKAKVMMRNINMISYCDGNFRTAHILKKLFMRLLNKGYTEEEAKQILSQVFVLQIVDNYRDSIEMNAEIPYATIVTVHDIFDLQNSDFFDLEEELNEQNKTLFDRNPFIHLDTYNNSDRRIIYKSFGEGSLSQRKDTHIFTRDYAKAPIINYIMSLYLIKALHMSLEHIEINDNISLQSEIASITQRALDFIKQKGKSYDDFSREDLRELNEYLMRDIQLKFKDSIPVKTLTKEEKEYLNELEKSIELFLGANQDFNLHNMLYDMTHDIEMIYAMNNNINGNNNNFIIANIKQYIKKLSVEYNSFIDCINRVIIPEGLSPRILQELTSYLSNMFETAKKLIVDPRFQRILDEYGDSEIRKSFKV